MEQLREIIYNIFNRSLANNPAETAAFFILIISFFGGLVPVSEQMKGIVTHRRKNIRKHLDIEAEICPIEYIVANRKARMFDISPGGCMIENTDKRFKPGDDLKLSFTLQKKIYRDIPAEVVRVGSANTILHLKFITVNS